MVNLLPSKTPPFLRTLFFSHLTNNHATASRALHATAYRTRSAARSSNSHPCLLCGEGSDGYTHMLNDDCIPTSLAFQHIYTNFELNLSASSTKSLSQLHTLSLAFDSCSIPKRHFSISLIISFVGAVYFVRRRCKGTGTVPQAAQLSALLSEHTYHHLSLCLPNTSKKKKGKQRLISGIFPFKVP